MAFNAKKFLNCLWLCGSTCSAFNLLTVDGQSTFTVAQLFYFQFFFFSCCSILSNMMLMRVVGDDISRRYLN
jgi:hypothetical protein